MSSISPLQQARRGYKPKLPRVLNAPIENIAIATGKATEAMVDQNKLRELFPLTYGAPIVKFIEGRNPTRTNPLKIGVVLSGGQAPGGHNVIAGVFDALKKANPENQLFGFKDGPRGIVENRLLEITSELIYDYRNTGGFDIIGSGRTKLESLEQFEASLANCKAHNITGILIIGGDDSNTNAAILAEWFKKKDSGITVVGCPKTIDGDLKNQYIETSFGFDTATKTYAELIGNIARDASSAKKYWHFIRLMGRSASHITLECALKTHPDICIISEEVRAKNMSLDQVVNSIAKVIVMRAARGENFGVALIPEGLIEFIPEIGRLIAELNRLLAKEAEYFATIKTFEDAREWVNRELSKDSSYAFSSLPRQIQIQLLEDRDPHGNVQVSRIETEKLLIELVGVRLAKMKLTGEYHGKFSALAHFFGYEGRCAFPSNFDSDYCYGLGFSSYLLISAGLTGYIANIANLHLSAADWLPGGIPLTMMMNMERRHGELKPVVRKALVELESAPFKAFASNREKWALKNCYKYPGPIQYYGEISEGSTSTLKLEKGVSNSATSI